MFMKGSYRKAQQLEQVSPDTYSGDNQHIHASSFWSYLKE